MKKLIESFFSFSRGKQIAVSVALIHLLVLFCLTGHHLITKQWKTPRPMVIKTISPVAPAVKPIAAPVASADLKKESKVVSPVVKKAASAPKKKEERSVLKEIAKSMETLKEEPKKAPRPALNLPKRVEPKLLKEEVAIEDATYEEYLIAFLQTALDLPEFGEVKMAIEIDSYGKLIDCKILDSKSKKNAEFLKKEIGFLNFPVPLGSHKFTIVFRNQ